MAEKKKYSLFSTILFGLIALVVSGLLLASYLSMVINPSKLWFATFFGILYIPLLILGAGVKPVNLGVRPRFADIAATICDIFNLPLDTEGESFMKQIL